MNTLCNFCRQLVGTFSKFFSIMEWLMIRVWVAANLFHHQCTSTRNCLKDLVLRIVRKLWQPLFGFFMQNNHCDVPIGWSCLSNWQPGAPSNMHTYVCAHTHTHKHTPLNCAQVTWNTWSPVREDCSMKMTMRRPVPSLLMDSTVPLTSSTQYSWFVVWSAETAVGLNRPCHTSTRLSSPNRLELSSLGGDPWSDQKRRLSGWHL